MADEAASYIFPNLEPGIYTVTMMAPGFHVVEYTNVRLLAHQDLRIDGQMIAASDNRISKGVQSTSPVISRGGRIDV
jgi:hypothetical protein